MSALFASDELFEISIKYIELKTKSGLMTVKVLDMKKDADKQLLEKRASDVRELSTQWVQPSWKQSNELMRKCTVFDPYVGRRDVDWPTYRALVLETYMKKWNASEDSGKPIPCVKDNIDKLETTVAVALVDEFFNKTSITEEELGN